MDEMILDSPRIKFSRDHARKAMRECLKIFPEGFPKDIEKAVEIVIPEYNIVMLENLANNISALVLKNQKLIGINSHHPEVRKRFSIAHEIGHIRMDHPDSVFDQSDMQNKALEKEANTFAGEFLIPLDTLKETLKTCRDPNLLAKIFSVSREVIFIRLKESRLLKFVL